MWAELLNRERDEDDNDGIHPSKGQPETPTMAKGKSRVHNFMFSSEEIEVVVAKQITCTIYELVGKEIPTLEADSLDNILQ